jgi:hypothetical protein
MARDDGVARGPRSGQGPAKAGGARTGSIVLGGRMPAAISGTLTLSGSSVAIAPGEMIVVRML